MTLERPDLSDVAPEVRAYIEALEAKLARSRPAVKAKATPEPDDTSEPSEPPTTINVITISTGTITKRTPRHLYTRQRRGGMGVFDLDVPEEDPPSLLVTADESDTLIIITNEGRTYRTRVNTLPESPVRARGVALRDKLSLHPEEQIIAALPEENGSDHVALVGERGWITLVRASFVGRNLIPGVSYHDVEQYGPLAAASWVSYADDVFIASRQGTAIRFATKRVPNSGCLGLRLDRDDAAIAVTGVDEDSGVLLLSDEGKGTIRLMSGFRANKSPGGGGKIALKTDTLVGAVTVPDAGDLFIITRNSKIIRFPSEEIPPKTGPVQGVNCIALRSDEATACTVSQASS